MGKYGSRYEGRHAAVNGGQIAPINVGDVGWAAHSEPTGCSVKSPRMEQRPTFGIAYATVELSFT